MTDLVGLVELSVFVAIGMLDQGDVELNPAVDRFAANGRRRRFHEVREH